MFAASTTEEAMTLIAHTEQPLSTDYPVRGHQGSERIRRSLGRDNVVGGGCSFGGSDYLAWFGRADRAHYRLGLMGIAPEPVPRPG